MGLDGVMIAGIICWFPQGGGCIVQYLYNENINIVYCVHLVRFMLITRVMFLSELDDEKRVDNSLVQIWKVNFSHKVLFGL